MFDSYMVLFVISNLTFLRYFAQNHTVAKVLNIIFLLLVTFQMKGDIDFFSVLFLNTIAILTYELSRTEMYIRKYTKSLDQVKIFIFKLFFEYYSVEYIVLCYFISLIIENKDAMYLLTLMSAILVAKFIWMSNFEMKHFDECLLEYKINELEFQDFINKLDNNINYTNVLSYYEKLCFQEDKDFMLNEKLLNSARIRRFIKSYTSKDTKQTKWQFKRGYGTISGQITRCLFLKSGYSTKTRKVYEIVFSSIYFSTIENYLITMSKGIKPKGENIDKYVRYFYLHIYYSYIRSSGRIGRKTFDEIFGHKYYIASEDEIIIFLSTLYGDSETKDNYYFNYYGKDYLVSQKRKIIESQQLL